MTIGQRIKKRRLELGLSQEELAKRIGNKSRASVCTVEKDKEDLTTDRIRKYAEALECTPAYLMGWTETNDPQQNDRVMAYAKAILRNKILKEYMDKISELPEEYQNLALTSIDRIYEAYKLTEDIK